ncbi:MAG: tRNA (N(6)-L-threonylcarbamoyladenosine(37)-C(2))-methylthiotransferase MtaB, partial [Clostridia bacterium]|nr:tRNA (N(6)-L-threonylcarbamoyladenosine(37)-C(2))-methylthiotransferase MtaB [Clostridia bacterium]
ARKFTKNSKNMEIVVFTLGCKVNQCESDSLVHALTDMGHEVTEELVPADLYVVNTCAVTGEAEKKSRQMQARITALNPNAKIIYTGCASEKDPESFAFKSEGNLVTGVFGKGKIPQMLDGVGICLSEPTKTFEDLLAPSTVRTRSYVKIQDGCNSFCSYCIIPYLRGRSRSRDYNKILAEIEGTKPVECVINGVDISDYDFDGVRLAGLIEKLSAVDTRIRFGSLEARVIDDKLLTACKNLKDFAPHFHLSLQSGSDEVLKRMNRKYTADEYYDKVLLIRKYFPDAAITTDIIAGFPTETDENARGTEEFVKKVKFADIHPFPYSSRKGTVASKMPDLNGEIKKKRLDALLRLKAECRKNFEEENVGKVLSVLFERAEDGFAYGYSGNYIRV